MNIELPDSLADPISRAASTLGLSTQGFVAEAVQLIFDSKYVDLNNTIQLDWELRRQLKIVKKGCRKLQLQINELKDIRAAMREERGAQEAALRDLRGDCPKQQEGK